MFYIKMWLNERLQIWKLVKYEIKILLWIHIFSKYFIFCFIFILLLFTAVFLGLVKITVHGPGPWRGSIVFSKSEINTTAKSLRPLECWQRVVYAPNISQSFSVSPLSRASRLQHFTLSFFSSRFSLDGLSDRGNTRGLQIPSLA